MTGDPGDVGGILLAAGESTRFDEGNKLLAPVEGEPVVRHAAETLTEVVPAVVAVVGHEADRVRAALGPLDVETVYNDQYREGQSTSVAAGVDIARENGWGAVVFALGDMPDVDPGTVETLIAASEDGRGSVVVPTYEGTRGNPVIFDRTHYDELAAVEGDRGGREIVQEHGTRVPVDDAGIHRDIDELDDLDGV